MNCIKTFKDALKFRHACKIFDENKKIAKEDMLEILEANRLSPSSFGMEGWKLLVITNNELRAKLRPYCWNQAQITTCSHLVIVLGAIDALKSTSKTPLLRLARRGLDKDALNGYIKKYNAFVDAMGSDENIFAWSAKQTYIAAANMMTQAAILGIDSCPMEGFEKKRVEEILELDIKKYQVSLILAFGYRLNEQPEKHRVALEEIVEFIH